MINRLIWRDYSSDKPKPGKGEVIYVLVELEYNGKSEYHVATFHRNIISVGGHFEFDMPPIKKWILLDKILEIIKKE